MIAREPRLLAFSLDNTESYVLHPLILWYSLYDPGRDAYGDGDGWCVKTEISYSNWRSVLPEGTIWMLPVLETGTFPDNANPEIGTQRGEEDIICLAK